MSNFVLGFTLAGGFWSIYAVATGAPSRRAARQRRARRSRRAAAMRLHPSTITNGLPL